MQTPQDNAGETGQNGEAARTRAPYLAPDIDSASGELMQTIRGTSGACDVLSGGADEGCNTN